MIFIYGLSQKKRKVSPNMRVIPTKPALPKTFPKKKTFPTPSRSSGSLVGVAFFLHFSRRTLSQCSRVTPQKKRKEKSNPLLARRVSARLRSLLFILFFFIIYSLIIHYNSAITPYFCFFFIIYFDYIIFFLYLCIE